MRVSFLSEFQLSKNVKVLPENEAKLIVGGGVPNMYNPNDWPAIFALYQKYRTHLYLTRYNYPIFRIESGSVNVNRGKVYGTNGDLSPTVFTHFIPNIYGSNEDPKTTPISDTGAYGNHNSVTNDDGFFVPFYAFIRFVREYSNMVTPDLQQGFLNDGDSKMYDLKYPTTTSWDAEITWLKDNPSVMSQYFSTSYNTWWDDIKERNDIPKDNELDDDPYGYLQGYDNGYDRGDYDFPDFEKGLDEATIPPPVILEEDEMACPVWGSR